VTRHYEIGRVSERTWAAIAVQSGGGVGNAGIVALEGGRSLVVDAGFTPAAAAEVREAAERLAGPVERLLVTHADFDHYGGSAAFADVPILASERTRTAIAENGPARIDELRSGMDDYLAELEARNAPEWEKEQAQVVTAELPSLEVIVPTESFAGEIELGGVPVLDCGTNHTDSDAVAWFPAERVLFTADLVGVGGHLNLTRGDPRNWLRTLDRLETLAPEHVVPGHGPAAGADAIATARRYIETLLALAAEPGDHPMPDEYHDLAFPDGFEQNLARLRERYPPGTASGDE
jgi:cyclase